MEDNENTLSVDAPELSEVTPEKNPELFTDPVTVRIKLTPEAAKLGSLPADYEYECVCYPHTPDAEFETTLPDGYRFRSWDDVEDRYRWIGFGLSLCLDHTLLDENRYAEVFPASARQNRIESEEFEQKRQEFLATHPDVAREPMKATLTASEPKF